MIEQASSNSPFGPISAPHVFTYQKRFAEDYLVEPDGDDTLFTWIVAIEPNDRGGTSDESARPGHQGRLRQDAKRRSTLLGEAFSARIARARAPSPYVRRPG
jgi:hypothetical protein